MISQSARTALSYCPSVLAYCITRTDHYTPNRSTLLVGFTCQLFHL